jgi:REP element-mobilizing transposase RayT
MSLKDYPRDLLRKAGWHTRGYLPHFDGRATPQTITLHLADSVPVKVIERWENELRHLTDQHKLSIMKRRIENYLDQGYGECFLRHPHIAKLIQDSLLKYDGVRYRLFAWCVMPNHEHSLMRRFENTNLETIMQAHKSYTAHEANKLLNRKGEFWMAEYYDREIRNEEHFHNALRYIENNPVKAGLCAKPGDWPYSSAWFRERGGKAGEWVVKE